MGCHYDLELFANLVIGLLADVVRVYSLQRVANAEAAGLMSYAVISFNNFRLRAM